MAKWFGRIIYILFALLIVFLIEFLFGGVVEIQKSLYASDYLMAAVNEDGSYNTFDGMAYYNAPYNYFYSQNKIKTLDGAESYDTTNEEIEDKYKVRFGIYPFVSAEQATGFDIYRDGFYIVLEEGHKDITYYSFEINAYHVADPNKTKITLNDGTKHTIWKTPNGFLANNQVPYTLRITNYHLYNESQDALGGLYEYNINYINIYAHIGQEEPVLIYRLTDGSEKYLGDPLVTHETLNLNAETYNISKQFANPTSPTEAEIASFNLVNKYQPVDLSEYRSVYFVVFGIYAVILLILPYFMFVHKIVMNAYRTRKGTAPVYTVPADHKPQDQLFQDLPELETEDTKKKKRK